MSKSAKVVLAPVIKIDALRDRPLVRRVSRRSTSDPQYKAKAREVTTARKGAGQVVFWNVTGRPA